MKINILVSTHNQRIYDIERVVMPYRNDVSYVVVMQYSDIKYLDNLPDILKREDINFITSQDMGLCKSRNIAIGAADGDIAVIADCDSIYCNDYIDNVIDTFTDNPTTDVGLFMIETHKGEPPAKNYPTTEGRYPPCKGYYASSTEIAFRVSSIQGKIAFNEDFGLGAKYTNCGEEDIFLKDCQTAGLNIIFYPKYITEDNYNSTGRNMHTNALSLFSKGASSVYLHGVLAYPKMLLYATRCKIDKHASWWFIVWHTFRGINHQIATNIEGRLRL